MAKAIKVKEASPAESYIFIPDDPSETESAQYCPWRRNPDGDPEYIWHSHRDEKGEMVYAAPLEIMNKIPPDNSEGAEKHRYAWLKLFGGKKLMVEWVELPNKKWADDQRKWVEAEAQRILRRSNRVGRITCGHSVLRNACAEGGIKERKILFSSSACKS